MSPIPSPGPSHQEIASTLRQRIQAGTYPPGEKLPSTAALMREFVVSDGTIQRAVTLLRHEGLVIGVKGRGTFVRERRLVRPRPSDYLRVPEPGEPDHWSSWAASQGGVPTSIILFVGETEPPVEVAEAFGLEPGERVALRSRLLRLDGEADQIAHSYYPLRIARGTRLLDDRKIKGGDVRVLTDLGLVPRMPMAEEVRARMPSPDEARLLELAPGVPVLDLFRPSVSADGAVFQVAVMIYGGDRHSLRYWLSPQH